LAGIDHDGVWLECGAVGDTEHVDLLHFPELVHAVHVLGVVLEDRRLRAQNMISSEQEGGVSGVLEEEAGVVGPVAGSGDYLDGAGVVHVEDVTILHSPQRVLQPIVEVPLQGHHVFLFL